MRIVVFCPNLIGDTVMATPTLRALRTSFPDAQLDVVVRPNVAPVLDGVPWINDRLLCARKPSDASQSGRALVRRLRAAPYDLAILLPNSFRSASQAWLGNCRRRVGYARGGRSWLLTETLAPPLDGRGKYLPYPAVEYYLALARRVGAKPDSTRLELFTTEADRIAADDAWKALGLSPSRPVVCLNNGGAFGPAKSWPSPYFSRLAKRIVTETDADVLVLCGPAERDAARAVVAGADHPRVVSLANQPLSIGLSKACVERCALLVSTDSGPRHFAAGFGVPVVSLFGPTFIAWTRTNHPLAIHLQKPVPCGPCQKPVCPLGHHRCMVELDPDEVFHACLRLLSRRQVIHRPHLPSVKAPLA